MNSSNPSKAPSAFVVVSRFQTQLVLKASGRAVIRAIGLFLWGALFLAISPTIITLFQGDGFPRGLAYVAYGAAGLTVLAALWFLHQAAVPLVVRGNGRI